MESDTNTEKNDASRWFRVRSQRSEIEQLLDLYWGGRERRITGMTLKIIGVNLIALISLLIGVIALGQYHQNLIESKLSEFETETILTTSIFAEKFTELNIDSTDVQDKIGLLAARLSLTMNKQILVFDNTNAMMTNSEIYIHQNENIRPIIEITRPPIAPQLKLDSVEILKNMAFSVVSFLPHRQDLPAFKGTISNSAQDYPDVIYAQKGSLSISAWNDTTGEIILTSAMPILQNNKPIGFVMLINRHAEINKELGEAWLNIIQIFLLTLFVTILLSIYLSGVIARPLRKLARAAENVQKGKIKDTDIPDMSRRHDEIGELSIVLKNMAHALWDRMDSIESFASDVSHEIKNPLTSLKSAVETASIVEKAEDRDKLFAIIKHDIERLDRLITDISSASRLDAELSREMFKSIDLKEVLRHLIDIYKNPLDRETTTRTHSDEALKDGVLITLDLPDYIDLQVYGSEGRLTQVFHNILSNALSFSKAKSTIKIKVSVKENRATVTIEDEGKGIPENKLDSIFDRFYSERPEHEEYGRHSGLGLSICKQIITAHDGLIYAENMMDRSGEIKGARFNVVLGLV